MELDMSVHVAPLRPQNRSRNGSQNTVFSAQSSKASSRSQPSRTEQITPPLTPSTSTEDLNPAPTPFPTQFHNYLRAIYPYHPPLDDSSSSVTLPLNQGDLVLVHSVHVNGWADGTLLASCKRGWLPTNYCEVYEPAPMNMLMSALTGFYDIVLACDEQSSMATFSNQDIMRGLVAGIRYLFEITGCLNKQSPMLAVEGGISSLRRNRKSVLSELSSLVKLTKAIEATLAASPHGFLDTSILESMLSTAFRMVLRAAKFHEIWSNEMAALEQQQLVLSNLALNQSLASAPPPTPPAETSYFSRDVRVRAQASNDNFIAQTSIETDPPSASSSALASPREGAYNNSDDADSSLSQIPLASKKRPQSLTISKPVSYRVSWTNKSSAARINSKLATDRLLNTHETFLSLLQTFVGYHLRTFSANEILVATHRILHAGRELMTVVDAVWDRGNRTVEDLNKIRDTMYGRIASFVDAARLIFQPSESTDHGGFSSEDLSRVEDAATACVRAAGQCVESTRTALELIGDFEFETLDVPLDSPAYSSKPDKNETTEMETITEPETEVGTPVAEQPPLHIETSNSLTEEPVIVSNIDALSVDETTPVAEKPASTPENTTPPATDLTPIVEEPSSPEKAPLSPSRLNRELPPAPPRIDTGVTSPELTATRDEITPSSSVISSGLLPPLSSIGTPSSFQTEHSPLSLIDESQHDQLSKDTDITQISTSESLTLEVPGSESSTLYEASSSATTIDTSVSDSESMEIKPAVPPKEETPSVEAPATDDADEGEAAVMETTHAHELVFKDGILIGGTLPALVERMTRHDSTPDVSDVATFFLTFRVFTTATELAQALVDRFETIGIEPTAASPIKLRVYNVMKSWLESHWRMDVDKDALDIITPFAHHKLPVVLPSAAVRLQQLIEQVSGVDTPLLNRLPSKTNIPQSVSTKRSAPVPAVSKSQAALLRGWRNGGGPAPSIIDFDPLEVARQFTIKQVQIFCRIMPEELVGTEWMKKSASIAFNVRQMIQLNTDLAHLVTDTILQSEDCHKRSKVIKHWLKIGMKCLDLNNYDALMAIVCSINSSPIMRMKRTWAVVSAKTNQLFDQLSAAIDPSKNYTTLRGRLADATPPCIPFVGIYLGDLAMHAEGVNSTRTIPGTGGEKTRTVINFDKHRMTSKIISELQRFQVPYNLQEVPDLQAWIQDEIIRVRSETAVDIHFYKKSCTLEPKEPRLASSIPVPVTDSQPLKTARDNQFLAFFSKSSSH